MALMFSGPPSSSVASDTAEVKEPALVTGEPAPKAKVRQSSLFNLVTLGKRIEAADEVGILSTRRLSTFLIRVKIKKNRRP